MLVGNRYSCPEYILIDLAVSLPLENKCETETRGLPAIFYLE